MKVKQAEYVLWGVPRKERESEGRWQLAIRLAGEPSGLSPLPVESSVSQ